MLQFPSAKGSVTTGALAGVYKFYPDPKTKIIPILAPG